MPRGFPGSRIRCGTASSYYDYGCRCVLCKAAYKTYRKENYDRINGCAKATRNKRLELLNELKNVLCADCGGAFPPYVMDFDHRDPEEKSFTISQTQGCSVERLLAEVAKCDVVCANCHRIRTFEGKAYTAVYKKVVNG